HVLLQLRLNDKALPSALPASQRPPWLAALDHDEQHLLRCCLAWLSEPDVVLLYLQFYARLTAGQMAQALQPLFPKWTPDHVVGRLAPCWEVVLSGFVPGA